MIRRSRHLRLSLLLLFFGSGASIGTAMTPVRQSYSPLPMARDEYASLLCFATAPRTSATRAERVGRCAAVPALTPEGALHVIQKACKTKGCPQVDRSVPAILFLGLGGRSTHVLVAPTRSGIAFDPRGTQLPRTTGLIAVSVTDYSEGLSTSMEISTTERGRAIRSDAFTEPDPARPQGFPEQDRDVAVTMASFDLPHTPSAVSLQYVETDVSTLQRRAMVASFDAPPFHPVDWGIGFLVPFNKVSVDRITLNEYTAASRERIEGGDVGSRRVFEEKATTYAYLTGTLNMTGIRQKALEGEIGIFRPLAKSAAGRTALKLLWPDVVVGIGVPAVQSRFFKDNSFYFAAGWRLGSDRVRFTCGYQFTTLEILNDPYIGGDFVPGDVPDSDVVGRRQYHSLLFGVSFTLVSFGKNSL